MAKGYVQTHDNDYDETFTLVMKMTMVRVMLAVVVARDCFLHQMDVKNTCIQYDLEEQVFMVHPPSFNSERNTLALCRLKKSCYGLKQAPVLGVQRSRTECVRWGLRPPRQIRKVETVPTPRQQEI